MSPAPDRTDGCIPSKMNIPEDQEMEVGSSSGDGPQSSGTVASSPPVVTHDHGTANGHNKSQVGSQSQPATQPLDNSEMELEPVSQMEDSVWGQLYPHCGTFPRIPLSSDSFKLGRASSCDYVIKETDMGGVKWLTAVSKVQCDVIKNDEGTFIKDCSSNGTWVNGHKVGKGGMWPLEHNAEICFAGAQKKVFVFMARGVTETFPLELTAKYTVSKELGKGATGIVRLGFRIPDLHRVAIKIIEKKKFSTISSMAASTDSIMNEVRLLQAINHPCIINLEDVIDTEDQLYIVLELAEGGELFDKIIEKTKFKENEAKLHFYQMASAICYLHSKNICHRDLKPENVLLCSSDESNPVIKITDMGLSKLVDLGSVLRTFCGTPQYIAPEIVKGAGKEDSCYTMKVDVWSLGVILYIIVSGTPPFSEDRNCGVKLREQILTANYVFYDKLFGRLSDELKDLINKCLKVEPEERISAEDILKHPWLQDQEIIKRAKALMATQMRGKKRVITEVDNSSTDSMDGGKRQRNEGEFKTPGPVA